MSADFVPSSLTDLDGDLPESRITNLVADLAAKADATTTTTALALKAPLASPTFTGVPAAPTATVGTSTTQLATTAFVATGLALKADLASPTFTGTVTAPTVVGGAASGGNVTLNSTSHATKGKVFLNGTTAFFDTNGHLNIDDGNAHLFLNGGKLQAYHDGSSGSVQNSTGNFLITNTSASGSVAISTNNISRLSVTAAGIFQFWDGATFALGTTTGTKIGTATTQKLGFYNATPVVQRSGEITTGLVALGLFSSVTIATSGVTGLDAALALKAPIASPTFTGTVTLATLHATGSVYGDLGTATYGSTTTFDMSLHNDWLVVLGGNPTLAVSNVQVGQRFNLILDQGSGGRTVTWFSGIRWANGTVPTLTATASKADVFNFWCISSGVYLGSQIGPNY